MNEVADGRSWGAWAGVLTLGLLVWSAPVAGQSSLEDVERLTRLGRTEAARATLMTWWSDERPDASRRERQRALWLRGRLTVDPVQAELDFRRLTVLYPSGRFTPDAIFRLAQASWAMGDEAEARGYVETLRRDYPRTEAREDAEAWLEDAGPLPPPGDTPTPPVSTTDTSPSSSTPPPARSPDQTERQSPETADIGDEAVMNYYVQLGAFGEEERALALFEEVSAAGVEVRVVRVEGSLFTHVRV
ncbi:MAG: SPOR domain-containing protein, partial [Gemmatimonadota bacterium]